MADALASLGLDTREYQKAARVIEAQNRKMEASARRVDGAVKKFGTGLASVLGVGGLASYARNAIKVDEAMEKLGDADTLNRVGKLDDEVSDMLTGWRINTGKAIIGLKAMILGWDSVEKGQGGLSRRNQELQKQLKIRQEITAAQELERTGQSAIAQDLMTIAKYEREITEAREKGNEALAVELEGERQRAMINNRTAQYRRTPEERRAERKAGLKAISDEAKAAKREEEMARRTAAGAIGGPGSELADYQARMTARREGVASAGGTGALGGGMVKGTASVSVTGEALTELKAINKNTENAANPPNH